jgi:arylsulfatase A-like enzyme
LFRLLVIGILLIGSAATTVCAPAPGNNRHIVVIVWDGMRPDFVDEKHAPTLNKLAHDGVRFLHHHSVYPTATNVNGAAIATGVYPARSGLLANREYRAAIDAKSPFDTSDADPVRKGDALTDGKYLEVPTIAETVRVAGLRVAIAGSKSVALLHDRHQEWTIASTAKAATIFAAAPLPSSLRADVQKIIGPFLLAPSDSNARRNAYTTRSLTDFLWRDGVPSFSLLWLSEPDLAQHETSPGSPASVSAIKACDDDLAAVLGALDAKKARDTTDVLVVSDHGFSTVSGIVDFPARLRADGFEAATELSDSPPAGQILVVGNGGTILFYVTRHEPSVCARLVEWLQRAEVAGAIFTRDRCEGAFTLENIHIQTATAPDVIVGLHWTNAPNRFGARGEIVSDSGRKVGEGTHATLSPFDVHNTLVAAGPSFRCGRNDELASGNIDIAPTVLHILGLSRPEPFDGRVLAEALTEADTEKVPAPTPTATTQRAQHVLGDHVWQQYLRVTRVGETEYIDEGNGELDSAH